MMFTCLIIGINESVFDAVSFIVTSCYAIILQCASLRLARLLFDTKKHGFACFTGFKE